MKTTHCWHNDHASERHTGAFPLLKYVCLNQFNWWCVCTIWPTALARKNPEDCGNWEEMVHHYEAAPVCVSSYSVIREIRFRNSSINQMESDVFRKLLSQKEKAAYAVCMRETRPKTPQQLSRAASLLFSSSFWNHITSKADVPLWVFLDTQLKPRSCVSARRGEITRGGPLYSPAAGAIEGRRGRRSSVVSAGGIRLALPKSTEAKRCVGWPPSPLCVSSHPRPARPVPDGDRRRTQQSRLRSESQEGGGGRG